jgi:hypothetical protein
MRVQMLSLFGWVVVAGGRGEWRKEGSGPE